MSFSEEHRKSIKMYLMEKIFKQDDFIQKTANAYGISVNTIYRYLKELENEYKITKVERGKYILNNKTITKDYKLNNKRLEEHVVYYKDIEPLLMDLPKNIKSIWEYAFMEMFNNVIDHSEAINVKVIISRNCIYTWINIYDDGVGIFEKIAKFFKYDSLDEAIMSLFKGKLTTDEENHSGEGIFFTSRVMDFFAALSSNKIFQHDNTWEELDNLEQNVELDRWKDANGTLIVMALSNNSKKEIKEVFDMFADVEGGFTTTKIPMKNMCDNGRLVSRSQAKRIYFGFDKFSKVILDFAGVEDIGQGFAHEMFSVFTNKHPEIELEVVNANDEIKRMMRHVELS